MIASIQERLRKQYEVYANYLLSFDVKQIDPRELSVYLKTLKQYQELMNDGIMDNIGEAEDDTEKAPWSGAE